MAQTRKAKPASKLKNFYWLLGGLGVLGVAAIAWAVMRQGSAALEPVVVEGADDPQALVEKAKGVPIGKDDAPVKLLVFSDFQCPYCGTFALQIEPALVTEFVTPGKLQIVYYDFPLGGAHKYSFLASRAARCAGDQNKFWEYHNILFARQPDWSFDENPPIGKLLDLGAEVGVDRDLLESCVRSDKHQDVVSANRLLGDRLLVNATPTLFLNGRKVPSDMGLEIAGLRNLINSAAGTQ
ncbi:MAG: DsbA family protein [Gemmatimonadota bacterium]